MRKKIFLAAAVIFILGIAPAASAEGWIHDDTGWWYEYSSGRWPADRIVTINDARYYFGEDGYMRTGWQKKDGYWYLFADEGQMLTGWQYTGGKWYYMNSLGYMQTGWLEDGKNKYYLDSSGAMKTGDFEADGYWFKTDDSGAIYRGIKFTNADGTEVMYDNDGIRRTYNQTSKRWEATAGIKETIVDLKEELEDYLENDGSFATFEQRAETYLKPLMSETEYRDYIQEMVQIYLE